MADDTPKVYGKFSGESLWSPLDTYMSNSQTFKIPEYKRDLNLSCEKDISKSSGNYLVTIILPDGVNPYSKILYWAPKPLLDSKPYSNSTEAYANTPSKGIIFAKDGTAKLNINYPGHYWKSSELKKPHVHFHICDTGVTWTSLVKINDKSPLSGRKINLVISSVAFVVIIVFLFILYNNFK